MTLAEILEFNWRIDNNCVYASQENSRSQRPHTHFTVALNDEEKLKKEISLGEVLLDKDTIFMENVCRNILTRPYERLATQARSKTLDRLDEFSRVTIVDVAKNERSIVGGDYEAYASGLSSHLEKLTKQFKLKWSKKAYSQPIGYSEGDFAVFWSVGNGRRYLAANTVFGSLSKYLPEGERQIGVAYFHNRLLNGGYQTRFDPPDKMLTVRAETDFIYGVKEFAETAFH